MSSPKVAIIIYSMFGHIAKLAESVRQGVVDAGGSANIYQIKETLSDEVLAKMHAPPKRDYPIITPAELPSFDAYIFGIPTRYGNFPAQWKAFWDATGGLWVKGALAGKFAGVFVSTGTPGGGQETTVISSLSTLAHHGICFVPLGYSRTFDILNNVEEVRGGSPWGAGTFAGSTGTRQPTALELELARRQGLKFWQTVAKINFDLRT
ncbi:benzoquinone reductase [Tylopilus felleus]